MSSDWRTVEARAYPMRTRPVGTAPGAGGRGSSVQAEPGLRNGGTGTLSAFASCGTSRNRAVWYCAATQPLPVRHGDPAGAAQDDIGQPFASTRRKPPSLTRRSFHGGVLSIRPYATTRETRFALFGIWRWGLLRRPNVINPADLGVTVQVTNTGTKAGTPTCMINAQDASDAYSGFDSVASAGVLGGEGLAAYLHPTLGEVLGAADVIVPLAIGLVLLIAILRGSSQTCERAFHCAGSPTGPNRQRQGEPGAGNGHLCQAAGRPGLRLHLADAGRPASGPVCTPDPAW